MEIPRGWSGNDSGASVHSMFNLKSRSAIGGGMIQKLRVKEADG